MNVKSLSLSPSPSPVEISRIAAQCKLRNFTSLLRFPRPISCELSAIGLILKYKL
jgi:hypothetical protein